MGKTIRQRKTVMHSKGYDVHHYQVNAKACAAALMDKNAPEYVLAQSREKLRECLDFMKAMGGITEREYNKYIKKYLG